MSFSFKALGVGRRAAAAAPENSTGVETDARGSDALEPSSGGAEGSELRLVLEKLAGLERVLHELKQGLSPGAPETFGAGHGVDDAKVRRIIRARRIREQQLGPELFADPAWDLLLEAFAADLRHEWLTVSHLCRASRMPETTALRWIKLLEKEGWLKEAQSPDGRKWMELTLQGSSRLRRYFDAIGPASFLI
jgi:DNA-binding MarR family transcriptional regulator